MFTKRCGKLRSPLASPFLGRPQKGHLPGSSLPPYAPLHRCPAFSQRRASLDLRVWDWGKLTPSQGQKGKLLPPLECSHMTVLWASLLHSLPSLTGLSHHLGPDVSYFLHLSKVRDHALNTPSLRLANTLSSLVFPGSLWFQWNLPMIPGLM